MISELPGRAAAVAIRVGMIAAAPMGVAGAVPVAAHSVSPPIMCGDLNDGSGAGSANWLEPAET